jgi:TRAP transporter 4TM/12TM fusion protein
MKQESLFGRIKNINRTQVFAFTAILFTLVYMYQGWFGVTSPSFNRSVYIFFAILLVIINKPLKGHWAILDYIAVLAVIVCTVYFNTNYDRFMRSFGMRLETVDIIIGTIMIILVIEAVRRQLGWLLAGLTMISLVYLVYGRYFPSGVAHAGFSWDIVISDLFASTHGIYGEITYVLANYMLLFLVFGSFLSLSGAGDFYLELAKSILGRKPGGGAKAGVLSSFIVGSVTGSAAGNVAITGAITIPLMKKTKYESYVAGATEAVASTGGTILPPVMGAAAFIMSAITGRSYLDIIKIAAIPGILYFCSVFMHTHFYALKRGLSGLPKEDMPNIWKTIKGGIQFILPLIVLIGSLIYGLSLNKVAMNAILAALITSYIRKETRMSIKDILAALSQTGKTALPILAVAGPVSIISAALTLPGTAVRLSGSLVSLTDGNLLFLVFGIALIGYILGMGLDATAAYMVMATFAPAAMANLGVPVLSAHLLALWYGQLSNITPPVAMASYVAATIADANIWKVGMKAVTMGLALIYLPAVWIFRPELVLTGSPLAIITTVTFTLFGIMLLVSGIEGYLFYKTPYWLRTISVLAAAMILIPVTIFDFVGLGIGAAAVVYMLLIRIQRKNQEVSA